MAVAHTARVRPGVVLPVLLSLTAACGAPGAPASPSGGAPAGGSDAGAPASGRAESASSQPIGPEALRMPEGTQEAVVLAVSDGDTVRLRGVGAGPVPERSTRVRLLLVDAPETSGEPQCFGPEATHRVQQLLPVGTVVRVSGDVQPTDRYGRPLVHLWRPGGVNLGAQLVSEGYARVLQVEPNRRYLATFRSLGEQARSLRRGLWGACR